MPAYRNDGAAAPSLAALEAAELAPHKDESPGVTAEGFRGQAITDKRDCRGIDQAEQARSYDDGNAQAWRSAIKRLIVLAACWGFPAEWAQWLIERGGLTYD